VNNVSYQIKLEQFEGPFDLLLFFIERDELDIYNIPITKIINDFLDFIHTGEKLNIELSSEFILFVSTLMRIKARLLLPRKEIDAQGNEIDPRQELIDKNTGAQNTGIQALQRSGGKNGRNGSRAYAHD
jgi:segregation and condensation protein A